jgi:hypothetical protein
MTNRITREQAESCVEQVKLMFHGYKEHRGFGRPVAVEQDDCWHLVWTDGPYLFGENLARDVAHGSPGVPIPPNWPEGIRIEPVDKQTAALYPA